MGNPYSSPRTQSANKSSSRTQKVSGFVICIGVGTLAAILVYVGDVFRWPHFNRRAGYIGTEFIGDLLYAINDPNIDYEIEVILRLAETD